MENNMIKNLTDNFNAMIAEYNMQQSIINNQHNEIESLKAQIEKLKAANLKLLSAYNSALLGEEPVEIKTCKKSNAPVENAAASKQPSRNIPTLERKMEDDWYKGERARDLIEDMLANGIEVSPKSLRELGVANATSVYQIFRREYAEAYERQQTVRALAKNGNFNVNQFAK